MSFVTAAPAYVQAAAADLANIGSTISAANAAVEAPTTGILAAGADSVSAQLATLFGLHGQMYQALSSQAALFHNQFVQLMNAGGAQYALAEATNASPLSGVESQALGALNAPLAAATGRPLGGDGVGWATAGGVGKDGGWVCTNGGKGAAWGSIPAGAAVAGSGARSAGGKGFCGGLLSGGIGAGAVSDLGSSGTPALPAVASLNGSAGDAGAWDAVGNAGLVPGLAAARGNAGNGGGGLAAANIGSGAHLGNGANGGDIGRVAAGDGGKVDSGAGRRIPAAQMDTPSPHSADWSGARTARDRSAG